MPARSLDSTPRDDGFHMPAEWEPHERCYMIWPERTDNWRLGAKPAQAAFAAVAELIARSEPVTMLTSARQWEHAWARLSDAIQVVEMTTDDAWVRDTGPTFVVDRSTGERRGVDWIFNAWGGLDEGLYFPWANDDLVAAKVCDLEGAARYRAPLVLEGGSIHVDGEGTCITTEECLLNRNRNPGLTKAEIEARLRSYLGVEKIIWIPRGVHNDETDGHVDNLACFTRPGRVLLTWTEDAGDPQAEISREARQVLEGVTDAQGRALDVGLLPAPGPLTITAEEAAGVDGGEHAQTRTPGDRMAGSYVNFLITNRSVIHPLLDERRDEAVGELLSDEFPDRRIGGVPGREILLGGGNIHCITQQVPSAS
ncbi:MAG: agmatine deiminase [Acidimicrobiales bacterium]